MNLRLLGALCMIGAPCFALHLLIDPSQSSSQTLRIVSDGFGIVYLFGWLAAVLGLRQIDAMGNSKPKRVVYSVMLFLLCMAMLSNAVEPFAPESTLYKILDPSWPLSQLLFLVIGLGVARYGKLPGWKRYVPLFCGLCIPAALVGGILLSEKFGEKASLFPVIIHATLAWGLLGFVVFKEQKEQSLVLEVA